MRYFMLLCEIQLLVQMDGEAYLGYSVPDRNDDYSGYFHGLANGGPVLHQK